jgi:hypothetical protein
MAPYDGVSADELKRWSMNRTELPSRRDMPRAKGGQPILISSHILAASADDKNKIAVTKCARTANRKNGISLCIMSIADRAIALCRLSKSLTMASEAIKTLINALLRAIPARKI